MLPIDDVWLYTSYLLIQTRFPPDKLSPKLLRPPPLGCWPHRSWLRASHLEMQELYCWRNTFWRSKVLMSRGRILIMSCHCEDSCVLMWSLIWSFILVFEWMFMVLHVFFLVFYGFPGVFLSVDQAHVCSPLWVGPHLWCRGHVRRHPWPPWPERWKCLGSC